MIIKQAIDIYVNISYYEFMKHLTPVQQVEVFHLLFLDQLGRRIHKHLYAVKGGCNLRFFLKSIRYSQDLDLDIHMIRKETVMNNVSKIITSHPFKLLLEHAGIEIDAVTMPKQTDMTQRWKLALKCKGNSLPLYTKIEFSRRGMDEGVIFGAVDSVIIHQYQIAPIFVSHYTAETAFSQKVLALGGRSETQARDVFDLYHLLNCGVKGHALTPEIISKAVSAAFTLSYEMFKSQVITYLPPEHQNLYSDASLWDKMVLIVVEGIQCD